MLIVSMFFAAQLAVAQQSQKIVVTGTLIPIPLNEADRSITLLPVDGQASLLTASWIDLLRLEPSLDLQQRVPNGVLTDLSIRGSSFGQTLVLLKGLRLNDAQTGHFNMNLPVPLEAVERIEVLKGTGSLFYGSDAVEASSTLSPILRNVEPYGLGMRLEASAHSSSALIMD